MSRSPELELAVMGVLWNSTDARSPNDIRETLDRDLAYTTVATVLTRLMRKGLVSRFKSGRSYVYRPAVERSAVITDNVAQILEGPGLSKSMMARFVDLLTPEERVQLMQALQRQ